MTGPETKHHFTDFTPRRLSVFRQGYSLFVRILKFTLPLAALVIVGILVARLTSTSPDLKKVASIPDTEKTTPGQIELVQPKYEGVDDQGRPYTVTADKATRAVSAPDTVLFTNPSADMTLADKSWLAAQAKTGVFDRAQEILDLKDGVSIYHDSGYELHTPELRIYLKLKTARAPQPVDGQGPLGMLVAQDLSVLDDGNMIVFGGPATLTLFGLPGGKHG